jgi:hydrogenase expression/formation protein HypE
MAILSEREGLEFETALQSDSAALHTLVAAMLAADGRIHTLRDPTRGGVSSSLNEIAKQSGVGIEIEESAIPVREAVRGACELLGLDPLYVANEGKLIAMVDAAAAAGARCVRDRQHHGRAPGYGDDAHPARPQPHCGHALRRPVAPNLLRQPLSDVRGSE